MQGISAKFFFSNFSPGTLSSNYVRKHTLEQFVAELCYSFHILQSLWLYLSPAYACAHIQKLLYKRESERFHPD